MPDVALLPKLSLLLDVDVALLLAEDGTPLHEGRYGLIDLRNYHVDLSQIVYDKPLVYYLLSHFLLLGISDICVLCSESNRKYLENQHFSELGFHFTFDLESCVNHDLMIMNRPCFLFGSDLTRQFQGAMVANSLIKLTPENIPAPFLFCPAEYVAVFMKNAKYLYEIASFRTLGRGMVCLDMDDMDKCMNVGNFVSMYQKSSGLLIGSLEEIAYRKGIIDEETLRKMAKETPYRKYLEGLAECR